MRRSTRYNRPGLSGSARSATLLGADGDGSTLTLDFTTGVLDPRLSFERLSPATFINSSGLVAWAAANMITRSQSQDSNTYWSAFGTAVTRTASQSDPLGGTGAVKLDYNATSADAVISRTVSVQQGLQYTISVWLRADSGTVNNVRFGRGASAAGAYFPSLTTTWQRFSLTFTATGGSDGIELRVLNSGTPKTASFHVFGAQLEPGDTMRDYNPALLDVPYHAPRFDHDPTTLAPRGLLIEGQTPNLLNWSESFATSGGTNNNWADSNITRTTGQADPANGTTAIRFTASAGNATVISSAAIGTSAARTFSVWLRRVSGTGNIQYTQNNGTNWTTQAITSTWTRYSFTHTVDHRVGIRIVTSGDAIEIWGAQLETGSGASSYIPTGASQATRDQDTATMSITSADLGFDNNRYTVRIRGRQNTSVISGFPRSVRFFGASTEPIGVSINSATFYPISANASGSNIALLTIANSLNQDFRLAWSMDADLATGTMLGSLNQSASSTNRLNTGPTANITGLGLNTNAAATAYASMTIRDIKFWPMMMNASQLNTLTAP